MSTVPMKRKSQKVKQLSVISFQLSVPTPKPNTQPLVPNGEQFPQMPDLSTWHFAISAKWIKQERLQPCSFAANNIDPINVTNINCLVRPRLESLKGQVTPDDGTGPVSGPSVCSRTLPACLPPVRSE